MIKPYIIWLTFSIGSSFKQPTFLAPGCTVRPVDHIDEDDGNARVNAGERVADWHEALPTVSPIYSARPSLLISV